MVLKITYNKSHVGKLTLYGSQSVGDYSEHTDTYSVCNSVLEDTLNNTSCLPCPGFEPGTSSRGTRKEFFCARLRLPLAALSGG